MDIKDVQKVAETRWGSSEYGPEYNARPDPQRDAHHATLHLTKSLGKIAGELDRLDHGDASGSGVMTALADIVICAARVASQWPDFKIDLEEAVQQRIESKFPAQNVSAARQNIDQPEMSFAEVIVCLRNSSAGRRMARIGWNGKGMWIELQSPDQHSKMTQPYLVLCTPDGGRVPWTCSQTDVLAFDWVELPRL